MVDMCPLGASSGGFQVTLHDSRKPLWLLLSECQYVLAHLVPFLPQAWNQPLIQALLIGVGI